MSTIGKMKADGRNRDALHAEACTPNVEDESDRERPEQREGDFRLGHHDASREECRGGEERRSVRFGVADEREEGGERERHAMRWLRGSRG